MKTKFYLISAFTLMTLLVSAQFPKYNTMLIEEWTNNAWANMSRSVNTFDDNGNVVKTTLGSWDAETSAWMDSVAFIHTLNSDATIRETLFQVWENNAWVDFQKTVYTYSATKKVLTETTQVTFEDITMDWGKVTYTYNQMDSLETELTQSVNLLTGQLGNSTLDTYSYNTDGTLNQSVTQTWSLAGAWENESRVTNTYDNAKKVTSDLSEKWVDNAWVNDTRTTYTLTAGGLLQESLEELWDGEKWVNFAKDSYTFTGSQQLQQIVSQEWTAESSQWTNTWRVTFTFGPTGIIPDNQTVKAFLVFPNPFEDQVTIQSGLMKEHSIDIINVSGQVVKSFKTNEKTLKLDLGSLDKGAYFIKLKSPEYGQSIKVLKVK